MTFTEAYAGEREASAVTWLVEQTANPYVRGRIAADKWQERNKYLYRSLTWRQRSSFAHDLRNGDPFSGVPMDVVVEAKRRFQWAETSWLGGYLSPQSFLEEALAWDKACAFFREVRYQHPRQLDTESQIAKEERHLRRLARENFFDRPAWTRLAQAMQELRDRRNRWEQRQLLAQETQKQRRLLREGRRTLTAIRQYLRGATASPPPESRPVRTSPI